MSGDMSQGQTETPKTKAELFAENPDRFFDLEEAIFLVARHPKTKNVGVFVGARSIEESVMAEYAAHQKLEQWRSERVAAFEQLQKAAALEAAPKNGILDFMRNGKKH